MSFLFASSHLPETRVKRPEPSGARQTAKAARRANAVSQHEEEEEEEEEDVQPMRRSGGVRAFSHLPDSPHRAPPEHGTAVDPADLEKIEIDDPDPRFVQHVREALRAEVAGSPVAAALLAHVGRLPYRTTLKRRERGMSQTATDEDGHATLHLNPGEMTGATFSHELAHIIQQAHTHHALQHLRHQRRQPTAADVEAAIMAGRDALHRIVPVKDTRDPGHEHKENEAMRVSNIVNAEHTAAQMKDLPAHQRTPAEFRRRQSHCESAPRHQDNHHPLPPGSHYGEYDFQHVKQLLGF